jgi:hypothetical protein
MTGRSKTKPNAGVAAWRVIDQVLEPKNTSISAVSR